MKVLFLCQRFYPEIGGVETHAFRVAEELLKKKHEVNVLTEIGTINQHNNKIIYQSRGKSDNKNLNSKQPVKSIQTYHFEVNDIKVLALNFGKNNWFKKFRIWGSIASNLSLLRNADVVHCHDVFFWYIPFRFFFPKKKVFVTFHGYETKFPPTLKAKLIRKLSEILSGGNICVGKFIEKWYGTKPDYITYGGVDSKYKTKNLRQDKFGKKLKFVFLGRLEKDNGLDVYLDALKILKKQDVDFDFVAVGDGSLRKDVEKLGKVVGFVQNVGKYINTTRYVFSSSYLSILESLASKKTVFAVYQNPLKRDYLEMSPFADFINIDSEPAVLAEKLKTGKFGNAKLGYEWAREQSWANVANLYIKLWNK